MDSGFIMCVKIQTALFRFVPIAVKRKIIEIFYFFVGYQKASDKQIFLKVRPVFKLFLKHYNYIS